MILKNETFVEYDSILYGLTQHTAIQPQTLTLSLIFSHKRAV